MRNMRYVLVLIAFVTIMSCNAQIGINYRYQNLNPGHWEDITKTKTLYNNTSEIGIDYWFRLKNYRVEFSPEIFIARSTTNTNSNEYRYSAYGVAANTNVYIFDFIGDCNCPTFSKDGNFFTKGFFVSVATSFEYQENYFKNEDVELDQTNRSRFTFALGAGVDIGLTDLLTITPYIRYKIVPNVVWDGLAVANGSNVVHTDETFHLAYPQFGLRLGFRPDYVREQNKFKKKRRRRK